jgi:hypothetical protein
VVVICSGRRGRGGEEGGQEKEKGGKVGGKEGTRIWGDERQWGDGSMCIGKDNGSRRRVKEWVDAVLSKGGRGWMWRC